MKIRTERARYRWICNGCRQIQPIGSRKHLIGGYPYCEACASAMQEHTP
jgi:hypothetical protein